MSVNGITVFKNLKMDIKTINEYEKLQLQTNDLTSVENFNIMSRKMKSVFTSYIILDSTRWRNKNRRTCCK